MLKIKRLLVVLFIASFCSFLNAEMVHMGTIDSKYFYVCDKPVNIRSEGSLSGVKIDQLFIGEEVEVLSAGRKEAIDGTEENSWYKIRYQGEKIGWVYGKYLATQTIVCELDHDGTKDYVFVRMHEYGNFYTLSPREDILIYVDGEKLSTEMIQKRKPDCSHIYFYIAENKILITVENKYDYFTSMDDSGPDGIAAFLFLLSRNGIEYVETIYKNESNKRRNQMGWDCGEIVPGIIEPILGSEYHFVDYLVNYDALKMLNDNDE